MAENMKSQLAKYLKSDGYYDILQIRRDLKAQGYVEPNSFDVIFADDNDPDQPITAPQLHPLWQAAIDANEAKDSEFVETTETVVEYWENEDGSATPIERKVTVRKPKNTIDKSTEPDHSATPPAASTDAQPVSANETVENGGLKGATIETQYGELMVIGVKPAPELAQTEREVSDITPADRAAVEAMGEVAANVFGEDEHCEKCGKRIYPRSGMCPDCFSAWLHTVPAIDNDTPQPNVLDVPASDEIAHEDAVSHVSHAEYLQTVIQTLYRHQDYSPETALQLAESAEKALSALQSALAAANSARDSAVAALTEIRDIPEYPVQISNQMLASELFDAGKNVTLKKVKAIAETTLETLAQSGAGEGK